MAKICSNCGAQSEDNARLCGQCGMPLPFSAAAAPQSAAAKKFAGGLPDGVKKAVDGLKDPNNRTKIIAVAAALVVVLVAGLYFITGSAGCVARSAARAYKKDNAKKLASISTKLLLDYDEEDEFESKEDLQEEYEKTMEIRRNALENSLGSDYRLSSKIVYVNKYTVGEVERLFYGWDNLVSCDYYGRIKYVEVQMTAKEKDGKETESFSVGMILVRSFGRWELLRLG